MLVCKICNKECDSSRSLFAHIRCNHNLSKINYLKQFNLIPKCKYCDNLVAIVAKGTKLSTLCGNKECLTKSLKERITEETIKKLRNKRLNYIKNNPNKTAWRKNTISYPEKCFLEHLKKLGWNKKYNIVREVSVFPYYIDFGFIDLKIALEIDGSQHKEKERKKSDNKKDKVLIKNNWRIFRIEAINLYHNIDKVFFELERFLIDLKVDKKELKIFPEILKEKEIKNKKIEEKRQKLLKEKQNLINNRLNDYINIEKKRGWLCKLSKKWNISHTQTRRYINKYLFNKN